MGWFSGASSFVHRNTATLRQTPNIKIPTVNDIKRDVVDLSTGNVGGIIDRNTDSVNSIQLEKKVIELLLHITLISNMGEKH